ncbi:hypothetical protein niasHT_015709 [Heterodera trifolii]|uniref:Uncharacterized protein n=1 Tax=Heterodera trifolii TaxID=157864 RepID=A0ABD2L4I9_9BILA
MKSISDLCNEINLRLTINNGLMNAGWKMMENAVISLWNCQMDFSHLKRLQSEHEATIGLLALKINKLLKTNAVEVVADTVKSNSFNSNAHQKLLQRLRHAIEDTNAEADRLENDYFLLQEQIAAMRHQLVVHLRRQLEQQKKIKKEQHEEEGKEWEKAKEERKTDKSKGKRTKRKMEEGERRKNGREEGQKRKAIYHIY